MLKLGAQLLKRCVVNQQRCLVIQQINPVNRFSTHADVIFSKQLKLFTLLGCGIFLFLISFIFFFFLVFFRKFKDEKVSEAENSLELIFAHVLQQKKLSRVRGEELKKFKLTDEQVETILAMCQCRSGRMPVQYILKEWEFRDLTLKMRIPVFIPRPVRFILQFFLILGINYIREYLILFLL